MEERLGLRICNYQSDNGQFVDNTFVQQSKIIGQGFIYRDVHDHFQNGIAERNIRDLQDRARKMIIHAKNKWPEAIDTSL
jgi:hypothetical protein